ncbi:MAG TPA: translation initiation factor IF-3 [Geobacteraceae bacterium]|nr:translation initiation factor IF-3 [Geobacteraceae bacterium]
MAKPTVNINQAIRAREVRVVGAESDQLGIMPLKEALALAESQHLDLVEVSPNSTPPVCRIMDYGKYKYQQSKKQQEARKKQVQIQLKEIKLRPKTDEHDLQFKIKHARRFIEEGNKAKISVIFRGREITHTELGQRALDRFVEELEDIANIEVRPRMEGRNMYIIVSPKK